jgi:hypothetical protein
MARKTIDVEQVKDKANKALSDPDTQANQVRYQGGEGRAVAYRQGVAAVLESVLMDTGNYKGFEFTDGNNGRTDMSKRRYY